jgi:hypothetical protein
MWPFRFLVLWSRVNILYLWGWVSYDVNIIFVM